MALTLLLVLIGVGVVSAGEPGLVPPAPEVAKGQPSVSAQARNAALFQARPLAPGNAQGSGVGSTDDRFVQLQNKRTGVTCSARIVKVEPNVDPGILPRTLSPHPDSIVRNAPSPCVE